MPETQRAENILESVLSLAPAIDLSTEATNVAILRSF